MKDFSGEVFRSALLLGFVALLGTGILVSVFHLTDDRIQEQERRAVLALLNQVIGPDEYDNPLHEDMILIPSAPGISHAGPLRVYRARNAGANVGMVVDMVTPEGYNGAIRLLVGIRDSGAISGVRVVSHRETPGLGDPVELTRSDWILGFDGRSTGDPDPAGWAVKRDGGVFDQFTGATITPRAVVEAVQATLEYCQRNREALYRQSPTEES